MPVFWPREFHGLYSSWGRKESDMTKRLSTHSLTQRSLRLSSALFILFTLFCSSEVVSTSLSYSSLICSFAPDILLLIPSRVFLISVIVLSLHVYSFILLGLCLEKAMAPHSSTLAWKIPWMEEPGRLQSMGSLRVGHD